jgi:hypothetical protein
MNTVDRPRIAPRAVPWRVRPVGEALVRNSRSLVRDAWQNRPLRIAALWGLAAWVILQGAFQAWVHFNCEGVSHRAFLPGLVFTVPEREAAAGFKNVARVGYDGQIYYWMSNDIFGRRDAHKHMDDVLYRYQRIGVPMLAGGLATVLGFELTPPLLYHSVQFGITALGFAALVYWLQIKGLNPAYALGWLISGGTLQSLWLGILDAPGDALFVCTVLVVFTQRLWIYAPLATLLLLTREGYAVYAFAIFAVTVASRFAWHDKAGNLRRLPRISWKDVSGYWPQVVLTALPGVVMLAWTAYLTFNFHKSPIAARSNPDATNWPYYMMVRFLSVFFRDGNWFELRLLAASAVTLTLISILFAKNFRRLPLAVACAAPYILLTAALGKMVWEAYGGHMTASGSIIILGLFMLPLDKSILLRFVLAGQALIGIDLIADVRLMHTRILSPLLIHEEAGYDFNPPGAPDNAVLANLANSIAWVDPPEVMRQEYHGVFSRVHREVRPVKVAVTNHTDVTWNPGRGQHPIFVSCAIYEGQGKRQLAEHRAILEQSIAPGETKEVTALVELPRPKRNYVAELSLFQDGRGHFVRVKPEFGRRYKFRVE